MKPRMKTNLVMTVLGPDRPGLVQSLSSVVADHGGNWLESRMARMAGQFAGILRVECPAASTDALIAALEGVRQDGLSVQVARENVADETARVTLTIDVVGNDRPGIVRQLAAAVASVGGNVEELTTGLESAPMSGHPIFRARGVVSMPEGSDASRLAAAIEHLGPDLSVDIAL